MAVRCRHSKPAYHSAASVDVPVLVHPSLLEPWSKSRIQRVSVVLCSDSDVYLGYDEELEGVLSDADRVINACPSLLSFPHTSNTSTLLVPKTYDRTLIDTKEEETHSKDSFSWDNQPQNVDTSLADTQTTLGNQETQPITSDGKSPFEIIADFNRKSPTKKLDSFNRPVLKQGPAGVIPTLKAELALTLPSADSLLKQLSELRTQRIAELRQINRLERFLEGKVTPESSELSTDH